MDVGTSHPIVARLGLGMFEIADFTQLPVAQTEFIKGKMFEAFPLLLKTEGIAKPIISEVNGILEELNTHGLLQDADGKPEVPPKCIEISKSREFLLQCRPILDLIFSVMNALWGSTFSRDDFVNIREFAVDKFGKEHILSKLLNEDFPWLVDLTALIAFAEGPDFQVKDFQISEAGPDGKFTVTLPTFTGQKQVGNLVEVYQHNLFTFVEEITVFALAEHLDKRLVIYEIPEGQRSKDAAVRFRVGVKPGVDINIFKGDPRCHKIYLSGQHFFHMREQLREGKFGRVRPIIHSELKGNKVVAVNSTIYYGKWVTFTDFLYDYLKIKFGKDWWLAEAKKTEILCSPILTWARRLYEHQKAHSTKEAGLFGAIPNGPMSAYFNLAYDLFVLEDNRALQESILERMRRADKTAFWGARYEAMVAATMIKAGFDIEYEDEADNRAKHPEFIGTHRDTGEQIDVEAKKRNRTIKPKSDEEVKLEIEDLLRGAVRKFRGNPLVIFLELDLPPIDGNPLQKPWFKELLQSIEGAGVRDADGKDFCNMIVFTNYPTEHVEDISKYPSQSFIISQSNVPKFVLKNPIHLIQIRSAVEKHEKIPGWFEE